MTAHPCKPIARYVYRVSTLEPFTDPKADGSEWALRFSGVTRHHLRKRVNELLSQGYDREASILIEKEKRRRQVQRYLFEAQS